MTAGPARAPAAGRHRHVRARMAPCPTTWRGAARSCSSTASASTAAATAMSPSGSPRSASRSAATTCAATAAPDGARGSVPRADALLADLRFVFDELDRRGAAGDDAPPLLLGHSLGGTVAAMATAGGWVAPRALILSSPALALHGSRPQAAAIALARAADPRPRAAQPAARRTSSRTTSARSPPTAPIRSCTTGSRRGSYGFLADAGAAVRREAAGLTAADAAAGRRRRRAGRRARVARAGRCAARGERRDPLLRRPLPRDLQRARARPRARARRSRGVDRARVERVTRHDTTPCRAVRRRSGRDDDA